MPADIIQNSFNSGEVSPALYSRTDLDKYRSSLRTCRNFLVHPTGGVSNRCGLELISSAKYSSSMCVTQDFVFNQTQSYTLEFGHLYVRFFTDGARIENEGTPYEVATPYLVGDLNDLRFESSADVIFITHPSYQTRTLTRYGNATWVLDTYDVEDGPFMPENTNESVSLSVSAVTGTNITLSVSASLIADSNIVFLAHMNGVNGSTDFTDDTGKTITPLANAQITTANSKFNGSSGLFDGVGDYLSVPSSSGFNFSNGDFRIRFWARSTSASTEQYFVSRRTAGGNDQFYLAVSAANILSFVSQNDISTLASYRSNAAISIADGMFHLIEVGRHGTNFHMLLDGVSLAITADTAIGSTTITDQSTTLTIGNYGNAFSKGFIGNLAEFEITKGTAPHTASYTVPTTPFSLTSSQNPDFTFSADHVGALFKLSHYIESPSLTVSATSTVQSSSIKCFTTWRLITHGTWNAKFRVEKSIDGGTTWTSLRAFSGAGDTNIDTSGTEDVENNPVPFKIRLNVYSYNSGTLNADLTSDAFYQDGIVRVTSFNSIISVQAEVLTEVGLTSNTITWSEGSWSNYRGWPSIARFFQDRLCFACSASEQQTIWMTVTSNYYSFIRHSTLLDTDGITINIPSRQINAINGLLAFKKLLAFTASSIWSIGPISGDALTPTTVRVDIEEYNGSSGVAPVVVGTEAIYNESRAEIIHNIGYQLQIDGFTGDVANILSEHLFQGYTVVKMAYQKSPNSIVWVLRSDGVLLALTYNAAQNVVAWTHHDTNGTIESICVIPGDSSDELWVSVSRTNGRYIERMIGRKQFNLTGQVFMDSFVTKQSTTLVISGLTHLENQWVSILADGVVLATQAVSASGTLTMSANYSTVYAGLGYYADFQPLDIDIPTKGGSIHGDKIKVGNITFELINSRGGYIGRNESNLYEAFTYAELNRANQLENETALGTTSNFSGKVRIPLGGQYSPGGRFFLRQSDPLPITIASIVPEVDFGGRSS